MANALAYYDKQFNAFVKSFEVVFKQYFVHLAIDSKMIYNMIACVNNTSS
jgi:hypothetical protein